MAHLDSVSPTYLQKVATDIGNVVSGWPSPDLGNMANVNPNDSVAPQLRLTETLRIWKLTPEAFDALANSSITGDLSKWVSETPALYHQIKLGSEPQGFARSLIQTPGDSENDEMPQLVLSQINPLRERAERVEELLKVAEEFEPENIGESVSYDPVVRLLEIPPFHVVALWLFDESMLADSQSTIAIIDGPLSDSTMTQSSFLTSEQFFAALGKIGPIAGVVLKPRPS